FSYLKSVGYDKWMCIEEASFTGMDGIKKAVDFVRNTWEKA
ncbi:MAG: sugar phosphate isomerase/epimerase, partial [Clostridia bacterium]|nr:sugar phosphate isomerase/epimerase [Clostridia bacterium]